MAVWWVVFFQRPPGYISKVIKVLCDTRQAAFPFPKFFQLSESVINEIEYTGKQL